MPSLPTEFSFGTVETVLTTRGDVLVDPYLYACKKHEGQKYGDHDYPYHLERVFRVMYDALVHGVGHAEPFAETEQCHVLLIATLLHDVVEDCFDNREEGLAEVKSLFGGPVSEVVDFVTDLPGENRVIRKQKFLARMGGIETAAEIRYLSLCVKMADRIANVAEGLLTGNKRTLTMYLNEHGNFVYLGRRVKHCPLYNDLYKTYLVHVEQAKELTQWESQ